MNPEAPITLVKTSQNQRTIVDYILEAMTDDGSWSVYQKPVFDGSTMTLSFEGSHSIEAAMYRIRGFFNRLMPGRPDYVQPVQDHSSRKITLEFV